MMKKRILITLCAVMGFTSSFCPPKKQSIEKALLKKCKDMAITKEDRTDSKSKSKAKSKSEKVRGQRALHLAVKASDWKTFESCKKYMLGDPGFEKNLRWLARKRKGARDSDSTTAARNIFCALKKRKTDKNSRRSCSRSL